MPTTRRYLRVTERGLEALIRTGSISAGLQQAKAMVEICAREAAADSGDAEVQRDLSISYNNLARVLVTAGQLSEAERFYRQALAIAEQWYGPDHQFTRDIHQQLSKLG
jgi:Tetratricopeptide repeat